MRLMMSINLNPWTEGMLDFSFSEFLLVSSISFYSKSELYLAIGEDKGLNGIQRRNLLKQFQIMMLTLTVMMISSEKLYMMRNI